jgi:hypothetical protein
MLSVKHLGIIETQSGNIGITSSNLDMWLNKLGKGMPYNILKVLAEKSGLKFSRTQIGLMTGYVSSSGGFSNSMSLLRKNNLIKEEGGLIWINPDL